MNPNETEITGMVGVCSGPNGCARLNYRIDLKTNQVMYVLTVNRTGWTAEKRLDMLEGKTTLCEYAVARRMYDAACASIEGKAQKEVA